MIQMNQNYTDIIDDLRFLTEPKPFLWLALAAVIGISSFIIALLRKRRRKVIQTVANKIPAERVFIDALSELEKLKCQLSRERSREYAIRASSIIRTYIEQRFEIAAPLRSTEEFFIEVQNSDKFDESDRRTLKEFLFACDFLKFARAWAEKDELENLHSLAVEFVKKTHNHKSKLEAEQEPKTSSSKMPVKSKDSSTAANN